ncbi:MAG: NAD(P)H-dependent oxidoreductase [Deltaproteobacteria bacterium]|nr:NAD(P)H-dependent oxidoreductase [Deltaproteobacteria bacterium]
MSIALINGSPKRHGSASALVLARLQALLEPEQFLSVSAGDNFQGVNPEDILGCQALVIAFPLYVDGVPAQLASFLATLSQIKSQPAISSFAPSRKLVYAVVNNGFHDATLNRLAIKSLTLFAKDLRWSWGQGLGVGGGAMWSTLPGVIRNIGQSWGPFAPLVKALGEIASHIKARRSGVDRYVDPALPSWLYAFLANLKWRFSALRHGCHGRLKSPSPKAGSMVTLEDA